MPYLSFSKFTSQFGDRLNTSFFCGTPKGHLWLGAIVVVMPLREHGFWVLATAKAVLSSYELQH
jgi:hypothetical protein